MIKNTIASLCILAASASVCSAQIIESVGIRATGMGGAFVAVADDSTATWWNPAGLAIGPFFDATVGRTTTELSDRIPARQDRVFWAAVSTPPIGFSYYRLKITDIRRIGPTGEPLEGRQDPRAEVSVRSLSASQLGLTVVQSVLPGIHAGATLKFVHGTFRSGAGDPTRSTEDLLGSADEFSGEGENRFDLDAGVMGVAGPVRIGAVLRNVTAPKFGGSLSLPRQGRIGAAVDLEKAGGPPLTIALDADVRSYATGSGDRRVVAIGAEDWLFARRLGVRGGARFNTVGDNEHVGTAGASFSARSGLYVEGEISRGGSDAESGWGLGIRMTF